MEDVFFALIASVSKEARGDGCGMFGKTPFGFKWGGVYKLGCDCFLMFAALIASVSKEARVTGVG